MKSMSDREKVINDLQMQIEELEERLAIVLEWQPEIVQCKDCKHQDPDRFDDGEGNYVCRKGHGWKPDNWFCADGERR